MSRPKAIIRFAMFIGSLAVTSDGAAQSLREAAREHARDNPGAPLLQPGPPGEYRPKQIEELAKEASVILQAKLTRITSYLGPIEDRILTDYLITDQRVIAGQIPVLGTPTPGKVAPVTLTVWGGEAIVEGVTIRGIDTDREEIKDGDQYLLFLMPSRRQEPGRYEIYHGGIFEIVEDRVKPLLKRAEDVLPGTIDARLNTLVSQIEIAREGR